ncbi:lamina-associated polypeptide 2, isoforms alpha/zeta-like [Dendrobates tinctorius]|uniref:lamina-associated polypeptide 2, isoforms alpha/zeta-like n=1 Tax=Dendrobates tinctorius TaxID=92724 RepID=UPI003CC9F8B2
MEGQSCFPLDSVDNLVKSVRSTMGCEEPRGAQTAQDIMFAGLAEKKRRAFPVILAIKALIKKEWEKNDQRSFLPSASKRKYPFSDEELLKWTKVPKVDAVISSTSRQSAIPVEDAGLLADPLDRKAESSLKRSWESTTGIFKPAVASTCTTRSMLVWLDQLDQQIEQKVSREKLRAAIPLIRGAAAFMADASADTLRLAARSAALVNNARRALWMKSWKGDAQSKAKICATPCEGEPLRGDRLEEGGKRKDQIDGPQKKRNKRVPCSGVQRSEGKIEIKESDPPVGGRLRFFYPKWEQISSNPWILSIIKEGMKIEFLQNPYDFFVLTRLNSMAQQRPSKKRFGAYYAKGF